MRYSPFTRLKVVQRLALGFGLVSAILAAVCVVGILNATSVRRLIENELASAQLDYAQATDMLLTVQRQDVLMRNIGLSDDVASMQKNAAAAREARESITTLFDSLLGRNRSTEERGMVAEAREIDARSRPVSERAIQLALAFQPEEAIKVINTKLEPLSSQRAALLKRFVDLQKRKAGAVNQALVGNALSALVVMLVSGALGLACAAVSAWLVARSINQPLQEAVEFANRLADGDLTARIEPQSSDEIGSLVRALAGMSERLCHVVGTLRESAAEVLAASTEIASGNHDLSVRTELQAASLETTASSLSTVVSAVRSNAESAVRANDLATKASVVATVGGDRVGEITDTMNDIAASSQRIAEIVSVIDGIAFQTNILALNAAVEAARAGENGRGFAVVAAEVRNLSQRSATAAREIDTLISTNVSKVANGSRLVSEAGSTMAEIVESSRNVASIVSEISVVTSAQAADLQQVSEAIRKIDDMTQQNSALVEEVAGAASSLERQTRTLNETVSVFQTEPAQPPSDTSLPEPAIAAVGA